MGNFRRNIKLAYKSVRFDMRSYLWFFAVLFIVQSIVSIFSLTFFNSRTAIVSSAEDNFNYHLILKNVNTDQYLSVYNGQSSRVSGSFFEVSDVVKYGEDGAVDQRYDVYVTLKNDVKRSYERFTERFSDPLDQYASGNSWYIYKTPLLKAAESSFSPARYFLLISLIAVICILFLRAMYSVRCNYFKFSYGIFMTFGAGFRKIFTSSFLEMAMICVFAIVPSSVFSFAVTKIAFYVGNSAFEFSFSAFLIAFTISIVVSLIALIGPCLKIAKKTPFSNIKAEDNSNHVTSPRLSFEFWKVRIPLKYEMASLFRFRKYNIALCVTGALFCAVFVWAMQFSALYLESITSNIPDIVISYENNSESEWEEGTSDQTEVNRAFYDDETDAAIRGIDGVAYIRRSAFVYAADISSYTEFPLDAVSDDVAYVEHNGNAALDSVDYIPCGKKDVDYLSNFNHSGDIEDFFNSPNAVVVSDSINNSTKFKINVGDRLTVASFRDQKRYVANDLTGAALLKRRIEAMVFDEKEYTVVAVLHDYSGTEGVGVFLPEDDFKVLSGEDEIRYDRAEIWLDAAVSDSRSNEIELQISEILKRTGGVNVSNNHTAAEREASLAENRHFVYRCAAICALAATVLYWTYAQRMFYAKRRDEFEVLGALGVPNNKIRGIFILDGAILGAASSLVMIVFSSLGCMLMKLCANRFFTNGGTVRYTTGVQPISLAVGVICLLICSIISTASAYYSFKHSFGIKDKINLNTEF